MGLHYLLLFTISFTNLEDTTKEMVVNQKDQLPLLEA